MKGEITGIDGCPLNLHSSSAGTSDSQQSSQRTLAGTFSGPRTV